jgi:hypothetical protein
MGNNCCAEPIDRALRSHVLNLSESPLETWEDVIDALKPFQGVPITGAAPASIMARRKQEDEARKKILKEGGIQALGDFTGFILSSLVLTSCKKKGARIPRSFAEHDCLLNLRHLQLSNCKLVSITAFALFPPTVTGAEYDVTENEKLVGIYQTFASSADFAQVVKGYKTYPLETLNISHNELTSLPPGLFCRFPKLAKLVASNNSITIPSYSFPHLWQGANNLTHLYLGANCINNVDFLFSDVETKNCLPKLHEVDLLGNRIRSIGPFEGARKLGELRVLDVQQQGDPTGTLQRKREQEIKKYLKERDAADLNNSAKCALDEIKLRCAGPAPLKSVHPSIYIICPDLHHLRLEGNAYEAELLSSLAATTEYKEWRERRAEMVTKQIRGGADVTLL